MPAVFGRQALWTGIIAAECTVTFIAVLMMKKSSDSHTCSAAAAEN